jgi:hypothetical protein
MEKLDSRFENDPAFRDRVVQKYRELRTQAEAEAVQGAQVKGLRVEKAHAIGHETYVVYDDKGSIIAVVTLRQLEALIEAW